MLFLIARSRRTVEIFTSLLRKLSNAKNLLVKESVGDISGNIRTFSPFISLSDTPFSITLIKGNIDPRKLFFFSLTWSGSSVTK